MSKRTITLDLDAAQEAGLAHEMARYYAGYPGEEAKDKNGNVTATKPGAITDPDAYLFAVMHGQVNDWTRAAGDVKLSKAMADPVKREALIAAAEAMDVEAIDAR